MSQPFMLGVNYWPRRKAMYWWRDFDAGEVREEFGLLRELGMNVVRFFLLWDDFQPAPDAVSAEALANLETVCNIAADNNLNLDMTFFTGHMSGPNWSPRWLLSADAPKPSPHVRQVLSQGKIVQSSYRNMFHDPVALDAEKLLLREVVTRLKGHPAIWMWNLGNEPDLFAWPNSAADGLTWVREMTHLIKDIDPDHRVTIGLHIASLLENNGLRVDQLFREVDVPVMHGYPMYMPGIARHELDPDLVPFMCALVSAMCGKPTLMEEWGGCTAPQGEPTQVWEWEAYGKPRTQFMASEVDFANYVEAVLPKLVQVGASGSLLWCYADYIEALWDRPPCDEQGAKHERHFGLVRPDGSIKPHAHIIQRFAEAQPTVQPAQRTVKLDITPDEYYQSPLEHFYRLYQQYLRDSNEQ
ncbi:MAG: cellulase family glycosylhydrolase [bacterium]|nr:cellulase family glycosylhydrolase [bacterium]